MKKQKKEKAILNIVGVEKCKTHKPNNLGYLQWFADAERRDKAGQKQRQCHVCGYFFWPDEY